MNIEKYLVLNKYLLSLFGVSDASTSLSTGFRDLQKELANKDPGYDMQIPGTQHLIIDLF
jgi:hypothetical protein